MRDAKKAGRGKGTREKRVLDVRQFARRGVVISGAIGVGEFLGEDALGGGDDEAGDLGAGVGEHFLVLKLDGLLRLGEKIVGLAGGRR